MIDLIQTLEYGTDQWNRPPPYTEDLLIDAWKDVLPPESIDWWAIGWSTCQVQYFRWNKMNPCSEVIEPVTTCDLPGPPGPPGQQGPAGQPGQSVRIMGSVPTASDLDPTNPDLQVGDGYIAEDTGHLWVFDGTQFIDCGNITGPQGPPGTPGADGADAPVPEFQIDGNGHLLYRLVMPV